MDSLFELEPMDVFSNVCEDLIQNLYNSKEIASEHMQPHKMLTVREDMKKIITDNNFSISAISDHLNNKEWAKDKVDCLVSIINKNKTELLYTSLMYYNSTYGESVITYDWLLKMVLGTSELKTLNYPLLQLIFSTINSNGEQKQRIYDINEEVLSKMIKVLEEVVDDK